MLINNDEQYCAIWDRVYNELGFKPSCDYRGHSLRVPLPFNLEEPYAVYGFDDMTDEQIDLVSETMKKILDAKAFIIEPDNKGQEISL